MDFNTTGPWELSRISDNAYKVFTHIYQRHCIMNNKQFNIWLTRLLDIEKQGDFNKLLDLRNDIIHYETFYYLQ